MSDGDRELMMVALCSVDERCDLFLKLTKYMLECGHPADYLKALIDRAVNERGNRG